MKNNQNSDDTWQIYNEAKSKDKLIKRMVNAHKRKKREDKIKKLESDSKHWSGLE